MDIIQLPFNRFIGIQKCEEDTNGLFQLSADPIYLNHFDTIHASAIYSLGEASSGEFLSRNLKVDIEKVFPILRRADIKYRKPATGQVYSKVVGSQ